MTIDDETAKSAIEVVKQVGFPALVAIWFMWRTDSRIEKITSAMTALTLAIRDAIPHIKIREDDK